MSDALSKIFDIKPVEVITPDDISITVIEDGDEDSDHKYARAKHYEISEAGSEAIKIAMRICRESESPKAIESLSMLLKNLSDVNKSLITINKDKSEAKAARGGKLQPTIGTAVQNQTNIVFSGNSEELDKLLDNMDKK
jgi:hypothetical protein